MALTIYTISDGDMMYEALSSVTLFMQMNAGSTFAAAVHTAFLAALIIYGFKSVQTQRFEWHQMLVSGLVVFCCVIPTTDVVIKPLSSGNQQALSNVPVGIAAPFAIITGFSNSFKEAMHDNFTQPGAASFTNADPLKLLMAFREQKLFIADASNPGDMEKTLQNYIVDCVLPDTNGAQLETSEVKIKQAADSWAAMKTTWLYEQTTTYIPGVDPEAGTERLCLDAYNEITNVFNSNSNFRATFDKNIIVSAFTGKVDQNAGLVTKVDDAFNAIGLAAVDSTTFMKNAWVNRAYELSKAHYASGSADVVTAVIETQAAENMKVRWTAEKSSFEKFAGPFSEFIELFIVGAAPIVIIAIALGPGMALAGKYLGLLLWIGLWGPTMILCNLYNFMSISKACGRYTGDITSGVGLDFLFQQVSDHLAIGSMMAASAPVLAGFLTTFSVAGIHHMASRLRGSEDIDVSLASPKIAGVQPTVSVDGVGHASVATGAFMRNGDANTVVRGSAGGGLLIQASRAAVHDASESANSTWSAGVMQSVDQGKAQSIGSANDYKNSSEIARTVQGVINNNWAYTQAHSDSKTRKEDVTAAAVSGMGVNTAGVPFFSADRAIRNLVGVGVHKDAADRIATEMSTQLQRTNTTLESQREGSSSSQFNDFRKTYSTKLGEGHGRSFEAAQRQVDSARSELSTAISVSASGSLDRQMNALQMSQVLSAGGDEAKFLIDSSRMYLANESNMRKVKAGYYNSAYAQTVGNGDDDRRLIAAAQMAMHAEGKGARQDEAALDNAKLWLLKSGVSGEATVNSFDNGVNQSGIVPVVQTRESVDSAVSPVEGAVKSAKRATAGSPKQDKIGAKVKSPDHVSPPTSGIVNPSDTKQITQADRQAVNDSVATNVPVARDMLAKQTDHVISDVTQKAKNWYGKFGDWLKEK